MSHNASQNKQKPTRSTFCRFNERKTVMSDSLTIGYIVHDLNDPSIERRCKMLEKGGAFVVLAGFYRGGDIHPTIKRRQPLLLGQTQDGAMARRAIATLGQVIGHRNVKMHFKNCELIMARNLEQLAIASKLKEKRPLVYECLDIHRLLSSQSRIGNFIRGFETSLLSRVNLLITSSPGFIRNHFTNDRLKAPITILENKLTVNDLPKRLQSPASYKDVIRIGWFGMLRCRRTFDVLSELAKQSEGRIEILIAGKPSPAELPDFEAMTGSVPGLRYTGPYTYDDLPDLYGKCHFAWAIDWYEAGHNSDWLLPNRIYEAIAHGSVPIVLEGTEVENWTEKRSVGLSLSRKKGAHERLLSLTSKEIKRLQAGLSSISARDVYADKVDAHTLVDQLRGLAS